MTNKNEFYKCELCGNLVSVLESADGQLVCCGQPMNLLVEKTVAEEGKEKHAPVIEVNGNEVTVKVGSIPHPMEDVHYIEIIQLLENGAVTFEKQLQPGESPEAKFCGVKDTSNLEAREVCNVHGLWRG